LNFKEKINNKKACVKAVSGWVYFVIAILRWFSSERLWRTHCYSSSAMSMGHPYSVAIEHSSSEDVPRKPRNFFSEKCH